MLTTQSIEEFDRARAWLCLVKRTKHPNPRVGSSYGLKHQVERYWGRIRPGENYYVSNGMFIAAALSLGFNVKQIDDTPNAYFNISVSDMPQ